MTLQSVAEPEPAARAGSVGFFKSPSSAVGGSCKGAGRKRKKTGFATRFSFLPQGLEPLNDRLSHSVLWVCSSSAKKMILKMVISLSSDKAVWDAVLNNEVVQELRGSLFQEPADKNPIETSPEGSDDFNLAKDILNWIFMNTKAKIMQLINKITELVNELFEPRERENSRRLTDPLEEMLKTSFFPFDHGPVSSGYGLNPECMIKICPHVV